MKYFCIALLIPILWRPKICLNEQVEFMFVVRELWISNAMFFA